MADLKRESIDEALENDRCGLCGSVEHFREDHYNTCGLGLVLAYGTIYCERYAGHADAHGAGGREWSATSP